MQPMTTQAEAHDRDAFYRGDRGHWLIAMETHRDADCLVESNWEAALKRLGGEGDDVAIERSSHWAIGWIDRLLVRPGSAAAAEAEKILREIDAYPVLDEDDLSEREDRDAETIWADCLAPADRIDVLRLHADNRGYAGRLTFGNLIAAVRGDWGWASAFGVPACEIVYS